MSDPKYKNCGLASDRVIEECSELIKAISKGRRFGLDNFHPEKPWTSNRKEILFEMEDVFEAIREYRKEIQP